MNLFFKSDIASVLGEDPNLIIKGTYDLITGLQNWRSKLTRAVVKLSFQLLEIIDGKLENSEAYIGTCAMVIPLEEDTQDLLL